MNFAFPAFLILILLSPGFILVSRASRGWFDFSLEQKHLPISIAFSVAAAGLLHALVIVASHVAGFNISFESILALLLGKTDSYVDTAVVLTAQSLGRTFVYFLGIWVLAYVVGYFLNWLFFKSRPDLKGGIWRGIRLSNSWVYYLSGDYLLLPTASESSTSNIKPDFVRVTAAVSLGDATYLYSGVLTEFYFDSGGKLDRLVLAMAMRRRISNDRSDGQEHSPQGDGRYYEIAGNRFVIKYEHVTSLNFEYLWLDATESAEQASPDVSS